MSESTLLRAEQGEDQRIGLNPVSNRAYSYLGVGRLCQSW